MEQIPELLYRLRSQDLGQPHARLLWRRISQTQAAAVVSVVCVPDRERLTVLRNVAMYATPGAAQSILLMVFEVFSPDGQTFSVALERFNPALAVVLPGWMNWQGCVVLPPGWNMRAICTFSAGAAANTVTADIQGSTVPLGTIQLP